MKVCVLLLLLALCRSAVGAREAVARFNAKGISGYIRFTEAENGDINIAVRLSGLQGTHNWHVHTLPIDQTLERDVQCLSTNAGPHYDPFNANVGQSSYTDDCATDPTNCEAGDLAGKFEPLPMSGMLDEVDSTGTLFLSGKYSIVGRSIVIHDNVDGSNFECGTIRLQEELDGADVTALQATFISPVAGTIYLRQVMGEEAQIWGRLFWVNDTDGTVDHNWHIHEILPSEQYRVGGCSDVGPHYDPTGMGPTSRENYTVDCTCNTTEGCEVGDLTGKHAQIDVPAAPVPYATGSFFFTDSQLNLTGTNSVAGRSIAVHAANSGGPIIACAPLVVSEDLMVGVSGVLYALQRSPFEDTRLVVGTLPEGSLTIVHAAISTIGQCLPEATAPMYDNTYSPFTPFSGAGEATPDRFPLGDLQQRYDSNLTSGNAFSVFDLPVYGHRDTISGRTLRLEGASQRNCWALQPMLRMEGVNTAIAAFEGDIEGAIYFVQRAYDNGVLGNTYIFVDLYYTEDRAATEGHNWHVHMNPPVAEQECAPTIGGHYNPFSVSLGNTDDAMDPSMFSNYSTDCSPETPLRCESGDLSNKHGQLRLFSNVANRATFTYVDSNVHLSGEYSIIGRSIGLHLPSLEGGALFECAEVTQFFVSELPVSVSFPENQTLRTMLASNLADPATDVLVLAQEVGAISADDGGDCVTTTVRGLGATQEEADNNLCSIAMQANTAAAYAQCGVTEVPQRCSGAHAVVSLLLLAGCLLLVLISF